MNGEEAAPSERSTAKTGELRVIRNEKLHEQQIRELDGAVVLDPDDLDAAILGVVLNEAKLFVAVYSYERLVDITAKDMKPTDDQEAAEAAMEWIDYNTLRAIPYMGNRAPIIATDDEETGVEPEVEDGEDVKYVEISGKKYRIIS